MNGISNNYFQTIVKKKCKFNLDFLGMSLCVQWAKNLQVKLINAPCSQVEFNEPSVNRDFRQISDLPNPKSFHIMSFRDARQRTSSRRPIRSSRVLFRKVHPRRKISPSFPDGLVAESEPFSTHLLWTLVNSETLLNYLAQQHCRKMPISTYLGSYLLLNRGIFWYRFFVTTFKSVGFNVWQIRSRFLFDARYLRSILRYRNE